MKKKNIKYWKFQVETQENCDLVIEFYKAYV